MNYQYWVNFFGKNSDDKEIIDSLAELGINKKIKIEKDHTKVKIDIQNEGIILVFIDEASLYKLHKVIGEAAPILSGIILILNKPKIKNFYRDILPYGLKQTDSQADLEKSLGTPKEIDDEFYLERWQIDNLELVVKYEEDFKSLSSVMIGLPGTF